jgi:Regulator of chromosome condensation (RCC1) repeat
MAQVFRLMLTVLLLVGACDRRGLVNSTRRDAGTDTESSAEVGLAAIDSAQTTYRESTEHFVQIAAGLSETCGIRTDGSIRCWGVYGDCQDVDGECPVQRGYVPKPTAGTWKRVSVNQNYACAIRTDASIDCWGWLKTATHFDGGSFSGYVDNPAHLDGAFSALDTPYAIWMEDGSIVGLIYARPPPPGTFLAASGAAYSCGIRSDGTLTCWGTARNDGITDQPPSGTFTELVTTNDFGCALQIDGQMVCWGWAAASWGTDTSPRSTPWPDGTFVQLAAQAGWGCGVRTDETLACWGELFGYTPPDGEYLQVAVGGTSPGGPDYGSAFFCALRTDGIVVCWGENNSGESSPP